jgi:glucose/arabinose dehydrogenase
MPRIHVDPPIGRSRALLLILATALGTGAGASTQPEKTIVRTGRSAFGDWKEDQPGVRRRITPADLPPISPPTTGKVESVPMPSGAKPRVPDGFTIQMIAFGLEQPRVIRTAPNGDLFVAESRANRVRLLRTSPESTSPSQDQVFLDGLSKPYGIAFHPPGPNPEWIYIANDDSVVRCPYRNGDLKASSPPETIIKRIQWDHHWTRDIAFSADGKHLFLAVGSGSNVAQDMFPEPRIPGELETWKKTKPLGSTWDTEEKRANILVYDSEGGNERIYATGIRNPSGITIQPATGKLWSVCNERDELGDDTPFEFVTSVQQGAFYGWPWYYIGANEDPRHKGKRPDLKDKVTVPDVLIQAHSSVLQIAFYDADAFPAEYKGDAFVTLHGSWNRERRTGYKVVRLPFNDDGTPTGEYEDFVTGFVLSDSQVWGRPVGVAVGNDGSLYITEDGSGTIWRVSHP